MSDQGSGAPKTPFTAFALPSVALLIVTTIGYIVSQPPLKSSRPTDISASDLPQPPSSNEYPVGAVYARMWEDPLGACYRDPEGKKIGVLPRNAPYHKIVLDLKDARSKNNKLLFMPVFLPGSPSGEDLETRKRTRYAVLAGLANAGYELRLNDRMSYVKIPVTREFQTLETQPGTTRRNKYLLVPTKLYRLGVPVSINENQPHKYSSVLVCWIDQNQLGDRPLSVISQVYENLFCFDIPAPIASVLSPHHHHLSINSSSSGFFPLLDSPIFREALTYIQKLLDPGPPINVAIIGPRGSDHLRQMLHDDQIAWEIPCDNAPIQRSTCKRAYRLPKNTTVYSATATATYEALRPPTSQRDRASALAEEEGNNNRQTNSPSQMKIVRCIGTDEQLVNLIFEELKHRRIARCNRIVLITERDTVYGRSVAKLFRAKGFDPKEYTYLRGVDGRQFPRPADKVDEKRQTEETLRAGMEYPCGASQLDYLRRLESQLVDDNERGRRNGRGEIRAIGVVGTDLYDKLLVLRALRKRFPRAWFFTTDLDAGFLHPEESGHTQNLLVASHFGLTLHPDLQESVPPFRDSYQTSTFFATMLALKHVGQKQYATKAGPFKLARDNPWGLGSACDSDKQDSTSAKHLKPLMFEIGRYRAYQLTQTNQCPASAAVHPESPREVPVGFWRFVLGLLAVILLVTCLANFDRHTRGVIQFLVYRPITLLVTLRKDHRKKLKTMTKAVTWRIDRIWESRLFVRMKQTVTNSCLRVFMVGDSAESNSRNPSLEVSSNNGSLTEGPLSQWLDGFPAKLRKSYHELHGSLKAKVASLTTFGIFVFGIMIWIDHSRVGGEPFSFTDGISTWPTNILRLGIFFAGAVAFVNLVQRFDKAKEEITKDKDSAVTLANSGESTPVREPLSKWTKLLVWKFRGDESDSENSPPSIIDALREFDEFGDRGFRVARALFLALLYFFLSILLFSIVGVPNSPVRGAYNSWTTTIIVIVAALVVIWLFMLLLDGAQLARALTRSLGRTATGNCNKCSKTVPIETFAFAIRVIGVHSKVIGDAMWWPAVLILLMVVARSPWFDGWHISVELVLLVLIMLGAIVLSGLMLRIAAQRTRRRIINHLKERMKRYSGKDDRAKEKTERLIAEIEDADEGAYRPLSQDPFLWALTVPFGGAGGLLLLERMLSV